jgi:hypothetical protein
VRTDLGGFYFHLIFGMGLMYLSLLTGWEWLLVGVLLINPGYGVPVHAVHALRRLLGVRGPDEHTGLLLADGSVPEERAAPTKITGTRLPNLKPWVKGVFATYVVVTVPVLALLLFNLITRLPDIIRIA